ncbi:hypothetical protein C7B77_01700 [Chamaesiphon polymorphus CCALA 037]|uniref:Uncharacterized protein n=2 Tax=Chamaesiphon TaxID=217161 RepID=A0A2T1GMU6_9CYAN|nr:hypothetical protein C7B77_01700 [Chamaesiphon polymorphus CCALA 037]
MSDDCCDPTTSITRFQNPKVFCPNTMIMSKQSSIDNMKSICFYCSYFTGINLPYYVKCYLLELTRHFNELVLLTNKKEMSVIDLTFLDQHTIQWMPCENKGFDFGMWYKAFEKYPIEDYQQVGLMNDSCILFRSLDRVFATIDKSGWDYCGILDSIELGYHPQSYFIVISQKAISLVGKYFKQNGIIEDFENVITTYEIGLSKYLVEHNCQIGAVYNYTDFACNLNCSFHKIKELIKAGFPLIKKKIISRNYRRSEIENLASVGFDFRAKNYLNLIENCNKNSLLIDMPLLKNDFNDKLINLKLFFRIPFWSTYFKIRAMAANFYHKFIK